ncbi:MAG: efflux RND transporter permease subunit [Marinilabiliales bacterium]|nr:efflux RND transporter permease subunit [Marinilabiliales bacterium]
MKSFFTSHRKALSVVIAVILLGGTLSYSLLQTSLFPEITFPKIKIIADAGQQPVDQMMMTVTRPLEMAIKKVPDLKVIRSSTSRGSCEISAFMDWKADINLSQQRIESKISEIRGDLPAELSIQVERMNPSILPVIGYTLEGKGRSPIELKYLANYTIKPFLSQVDGVSEVRIIGGKEKEYWVELNISRISALGLTPEIIRNTLNETGFVRSNGYLNDYRLLYLTITDALGRNKKELEELVVSNTGKRVVRMKDIATVEIREAKEYIKINANGKENVLIAVIKQPNANLIELTDQMRKKLDDLRSALPSDIVIKPYYEQADFVHDSIRSVTDALWIGLILAIVVAILFLRSLRASLTILLTIPVTICLSLIVLYAMGQTLNIMTLGAIAASVGLIIDDAIVVVEQIQRTHEEHPFEKTASLVQHAIRFLYPAMVGSTLSTAVIFLPFLLMTGVAGAYFKVMTNAMIITLVSSFFVTWLLLPVIYLLLYRLEPKRKSTHSEHVHSPNGRPWIAYFIHRPVYSLSLIVLLFLSVVYVLPRLDTGFLPEMDEGSIVLDYRSPSGTSLDETDRMLRQVEKIIVAVPEVATYSRRTGTEMGFFITEPNKGDYLIQLKKERSRTTEEVIDDIRNRVEATQPALRIDFGQVIGDMLGDLMESVKPIEVKIFGSDRKLLEETSIKIASLIGKIDGVEDVSDGIIAAGPYVNVLPDNAKLSQFGITSANLQYQLQTALEGNVVGNIQDREQFTNIRLLYPGNKTMDVQDIKNLQISMPNGKLKPIGQLAAVHLIEGDAEINRENLQNMGVVTARLNGRDLGNTMAEIQKTVNTAIRLPQGYTLVYGGAFAEQQQSFRELLIILLTAILLVFCIILSLFREFRIALTILLVAVLGLSGSLLALFLTGTPLNVGSYTGLIMIVGIIGENAIFTFLQFREARMTRNVDESIVYAISTRLRPKLMTALGAIFALMPIALGLGAGAQMHQPLAIAIIGGFIIALPLLLIVLPTLIRIFYAHSQGHPGMFDED